MSPSSTVATLTMITSWAAFDALEPEWDELVTASAVGTTFLEWEWVASWAEAYGRVAEPFAFVCRDGLGELIGVVPLMRVRTSVASTFVRFVRFIGDIGDDASNLDIIARIGCEADVVSAMLSTLDSVLDRWDVLELRHIPVESPVLHHLRVGMRARGWAVVEQRVPHLILDLPDSWDALMRRRTRHSRMRVNRSATLRRDEGTLTYRSCANVGDIALFLDALFALHGQRWASRGEARGREERPRRRLYELLSARYLDRGLLDLDLLELDGRPIAAQIGFRYRDTYNALQSGFDPHVRKLRSPNVALAGQIMRRLMAMGVRHYDYQWGDEDYKRRWLPRETTYARLRITRSGSLGACYMALSDAVLAYRIRIKDRFPVAFRTLRTARNRLLGNRP